MSKNFVGKLEVVVGHPKVDFRSPIFAFANQEVLLPTSNYILVLSSISMEQTVGYHFATEYDGVAGRFLASMAVVASTEPATETYIEQLDEAVKAVFEARHKSQGTRWDGKYIGEFSSGQASELIKEDISVEMNKLDPTQRYDQHLRSMHYPLEP